MLRQGYLVRIENHWKDVTILQPTANILIIVSVQKVVGEL